MASYEILLSETTGLRQIHSIFAQVLKPYNLTPHQWLVISLVRRYKKLSLIRLSNLIECSSAYISITVTALVGMSWVERELAKDKRKVDITFTTDEKQQVKFKTIEGKLKKKGF